MQRCLINILLAGVFLLFLSSVPSTSVEAKESETSFKFKKKKRSIKRLRSHKKTSLSKARVKGKIYNPLYAYIVVDADTGKVLSSFNADLKTYPASLTKMMTAYLAFEALESKKISLGQTLWVSAHAARQLPTKLWLKKDQSISLKDALYATIIKSHNDAAVTLAEAVGGTETHFAYLMTRKARQLGMYKTFFFNASGLPNVRQNLTTARDMMMLARALYNHYPQYFHIFGQKIFTYGGRTYANTNKLLGVVGGVDGLKTGYIRLSGFNLAVSAIRGKRRVIAVVMGGKTARWRDQQMTKLVNATFNLVGTSSPSFPPIVKSRSVETKKPLSIVKLLDKSPATSLSPASSSQSTKDPSPLTSTHNEMEDTITSSKQLSAENLKELNDWEDFNKPESDPKIENTQSEPEAPTSSRNISEEVKLRSLPVVRQLQLPEAEEEEDFPESSLQTSGSSEKILTELPIVREETQFPNENLVESASLSTPDPVSSPETPREGIDDSGTKSLEHLNERKAFNLPETLKKGLASPKDSISREWSIQVGAYKNAKIAYEKTVDLIDQFKLPGKSFIKRVGKQPRVLYEAHIKDLSKMQAEHACAALKAKRSGCLLLAPRK